MQAFCGNWIAKVDEKRKGVGMSNDVKTVYKSLGLCGFGLGSNSAAVDVKDGKILRIRPMHYDDAYDIKDMNPWRIEVNGVV